MAEDGLQGAMMAEEHNPDLIITDVMMPRMSGTEMCRRIKENLQTSHIPVILLTAWSTDEGRAEGYKVGADAYIAKPFDMDVLLARISNLLEKQEKRMHDFSHSASLDVKNIADSAPDEKFLKEIISLIEKNITDSDYTTDSLAADMAMSRMSLYRKMKSAILQVLPLRRTLPSILRTCLALFLPNIGGKKGVVTFDMCFCYGSHIGIWDYSLILQP